MSKRKLDGNAVDGSAEEEGMKTEILNQQFKQGDLMWVEIHESSWWPAQEVVSTNLRLQINYETIVMEVVDEGYVSAKPRKKFKGKLLVRLYGSYEYVYVDASKSNSEFEDILKRENKTMKEKFLESLEQDMSLMLSKEQSQLSLKPEDVSKDRKQQCELIKEATGNEADSIAMARKVCTNKEKTEGSSKRKQKWDFSKEENEALPMASNTKTPDSKKQKVARQLEFRNHDSLILRQSPRVASLSENQAKMEASFKNQEELKAKDLEIRKIVRDIIFGGLNNPPRTQSPKISKDTLQGGKEVAKSTVRKISETSNFKKGGSSRSVESNAEEMAAKLPRTGLKGKSNRNDKTSSTEAQKRNISDSKLVKKKIVKGQKAKDPDLEAKTPAKQVKDTAPLTAEERGPLSERQVRVMQNLALIAPAGSPFGRII